MECIIHAGTRLGTALGALAKRERRYGPDDAISCCMYRKAEALKQPIPSHNDYRGIKCLNPNDVEKMISIYEQIANESLLRRMTHSMTQNQNESIHSIIWARCSQTAINKKELE